MPFKSLRSKLIFILLLLLSLLAVATGFATLTTLKHDSELQARHMLNVSTKVLRQALDTRADQLSNSVRILAADFGFRRAVATAEQETIASVLDNHGNRINASLMLLLAPDGALLASSDAELNISDIAPLFQQTATNDSTVADIISLNGKPFQLVLAPVKAPNLIAWVGMGFPLDGPLAQQIKGVTGLDISFTAMQNGQHRIGNSTLESSHQQQLPDILSALTSQPDAIHNSPEQDFVSVALPLDQQQQLWALQHLSNQRWLSSYRQLRGQLFYIFGAALSLSLVIAFIFARSITGPIQALSQFAMRIGQGFDATAPAGGNDEVGLLSRTLSTMQQDIKQREQQLQFNAEHDSVTGLYNRTAIERLLQQWLDNCDGSLLQLNIQQFKSINDVLGFSNGDLLLQQLAQRLQQTLPAPALLARPGGDEFVLLYPHTLLTEQVQQLIKPLLNGYKLQHSAINLKLYAGIYNFAAGQLSVNDALRRVDIALENARQMPDGLAFYQQGQDESHQRELGLIRDLPQALHNGQFFVLYQPKVNIKQPGCNSAEALIRWQHPQLGLVPPDSFIKLAEHSGNIGLISQWMLQQVIAQAARWWHSTTPMQLAVNLSVFDLLNPQLADDIAALLQQHQLPAAALALEVTESAVMDDTETVIAQLHRLRKLGITLSIDDFGTGQSSLAYLKQLPVHEVKIDRAFVKDIEHNSNDALIVKATTQLAHSLGFSVTAEGLENHAGLQHLQSCGCDKIQGYYFAKPMTPQQLDAWLAKLPQQLNLWFNNNSMV
ncbi:EAL domain-containing protein [Rheinheimera sp. YQF-2]|uniref:EAL domain-containing protein n=1 Tax=Rheinheimera lutimaris TaxID=2740584 RepID=A0A7Y5EIE9_9GAMM|nr:EAL domain-containing protein [Rheinheimera lutimaris]NRQ43424.1 EAL domain-containing protein [Rheinheimera lutimaris]